MGGALFGHALDAKVKRVAYAMGTRHGGGAHKVEGRVYAQTRLRIMLYEMENVHWYHDAYMPSRLFKKSLVPLLHVGR